MAKKIMSKPSIGIIGFGRFGQVIHRLFADRFDILVSSSSLRDGDVDGVTFDTLENVVRGSHAVFLTVPINKTGAIGERIRPFLTPEHVVVDVCSVKEYPRRELILALSGTGATIWPTHPMFGPDSTKGGFEGLVWVTCEDDLDPETIAPYVAHLRDKGLRLVRTTAEAHDRMAARTQGLTHFIGRFLDELDIRPTEIDTVGYKRLLAVREQTCNDTWELFCDLQNYNRFSREIHHDLVDAIFKVRTRFFDTTTTRTNPLVGMIGAEYTDAETALSRHLATRKNSRRLEGSYDVRHFSQVFIILDKLFMGELDLGVFCLQRAGEAPLTAAFDALGRYSFRPEGFVTLDSGDLFVIVARRRQQEV